MKDWSMIWNRSILKHLSESATLLLLVGNVCIQQKSFLVVTGICSVNSNRN